MASNEKRIVKISVTPTLDTSAYGSGDRMGSLMTLTGVCPVKGGFARLEQVTVLDQAAQSAAFDIWFFSSSPTIASADNAPFDLNDANAQLAVGMVKMTAAEYSASASNSLGVTTSKGMKLQCAADSNTLYAICVSRGTPTYAASSLILNFFFEHQQ